MDRILARPSKLDPILDLAERHKSLTAQLSTIIGLLEIANIKPTPI